MLVFSLTPLRFFMGEVSNGVEDNPVDWTPPQLPAIAAPSPVPPSAAPGVDNEKAPDSGNADNAGTATGDQEATEADAAANDTGARADEEPAHGRTNISSSSPATPPKTPERDVAPPTTRAGDHAALGAETPPPDLDAAKPDDCATPSHDVEGSGRRSADGQGSLPLLHGEKPKPAGASLKRDVAAAKSRLLTFRSFSRDKKVMNKSEDTASPLSPAHGKAAEDGAVEHKEKGKERRKRFWK